MVDPCRDLVVCDLTLAASRRYLLVLPVFMSIKDRLPRTGPRASWRAGEQRAVVGRCLREVFTAEPNEEIALALARLQAAERNAR